MLTAKSLINRVLARDTGASNLVDPLMRGEAMRRTELRLFQELKNVNEPRMEDDPKQFAQAAAATLFRETSNSGVPTNADNSHPHGTIEAQEPRDNASQTVPPFPDMSEPETLVHQLSNEGVGQIPISVIVTALARRLGGTPITAVDVFDEDDFVFNLNS